MRWIKLSEILAETERLHQQAHYLTTEVVNGDVESPEYHHEMRQAGMAEESYVLVILPKGWGVEIWPDKLAQLSGEAPEETFIQVPVRIPTIS